MTPGRLRELLEADHARLEELLRRSDAAPMIDGESYRAFRGGLLRHIAMEEKVLLPEARRRRGGEPLAVAKQLRADHSALAALLVPTPTHDIIATIRKVLVEHNPLEEGPGGLYAVCEQLVGAELDALVLRVQRTPEVPLAAHFDGPRAYASIESLLKARAAFHGA